MRLRNLTAALALASLGVSLTSTASVSAVTLSEQPHHHQGPLVVGQSLSSNDAPLSPTYANVQPAIIPSTLRNASPYDAFTSISCTSPGNCTAAGSFFAATGQNLPLTQTSFNGVWAQATPAILTGPLATSTRSGSFTSISCSSPGFCTAVGNFGDRAISETSTHGVWGPVEVATFSPTTPFSPDGHNDHFTAVSCTGAGNCTAVGDYPDENGYNAPMEVTSVHGVWADAVPITFPSEYPGSPLFTFSVISCTSAGNCTAGGANATIHAYFASSTNGVWSTAIAIPSVTTVTSISCTAPGSCTAVGGFTDSQHLGRAMTISSTNGTFAPMVPVVIDPSLEPDYPGEIFNSVACTSPGNCTAVGSYWDVNYFPQALIESSTNGVWASTSPLTYPPTLNPLPQGALANSVSCSSAGSCTAAGFAYSTDGNAAFTVTLSHGAWEPAAFASFAPGVSQTQRDDSFSAISCSSPGNCTAAGSFTNQQSNYEAMTQTLSLVIPPPGKPTDVSVAFGNRTGTVTWKAPTPTNGSSIAGYAVTSTPTTSGCTTTGSTSCTISQLHPGVRYTFTVVASSAQGSSLPSSSVTGVAVATSTIGNFRTNDASLTASLKHQVRDLARRIATEHLTKISLFGYANSGTDATMSVTRTRVVKSYLKLRLTALKVHGFTIGFSGGAATNAFTSVNHDRSGNRCVVVTLS